jgi:hypothetical protein
LVKVAFNVTDDIVKDQLATFRFLLLDPINEDYTILDQVIRYIHLNYHSQHHGIEEHIVVTKEFNSLMVAFIMEVGHLGITARFAVDTFYYQTIVFVV